jgi:hypothetical protein
LTKGSYVLVRGTVRTREYERNGAKHRIVEVALVLSASSVGPNAGLKP